MHRKRFTPALLTRKAPTSGREEVRDTLSPLILRISPTKRSFVVRARLKDTAQPMRLTYPGEATWEELPNAKAWALVVLEQCRQGIDPRVALRSAEVLQAAHDDQLRRTTFEEVGKRFLKQHASALRSAEDFERVFRKFLNPEFGSRQMSEIGRADVTRLLDRIAETHPVRADRVLAMIRKFFNWYELRDDTFRSPIVRGMARTSSLQRARTRVLNDDELRLIWGQLEGTFGDIVKMLLLTAQRRDEVAQMKFSQIGPDGVWAIPAEHYKTGKPQFVPLSREALALIAKRPRVDGSDLVFGADRDADKIFKGWTKSRDYLVKRVTKANAGVDLEHWTLHDLRRTARTLMSRAGVRPEIAERVLGHVVGGVERVYDRYAYVTEKRGAVEALSDVLDGILAATPLRRAAE